MTNIEINNCVYKVHPVFNLNASDTNGILYIWLDKYLT